MAKKILVTGASGLLGTNTVLGLLDKGYSVRAFIRDKSKYLGENHVNLEFFEGDIKCVHNLKHAIAGCHYIIHIAAITDQSLLKYSDYHETNVKAVQNIIDVAVSCNVKKVVWISTATEFGHGSKVDLGDETKKIRHPFNKAFYSRSKKEAHDFIKTRQGEIDIIVVNPTFMIGAYDSKPSSGKIILMALKNKFVLCPPGGKSFVCVKDVVKGIINAIKYGKNGEAYILANQNLSFYEFFKILKYYSHDSFMIIKVPKTVLALLGYFGSMLRFFKVKTNLSIENMTALCVDNYFSNQKAQRELKLEFSPIENGIKEALSWFEDKVEN